MPTVRPSSNAYLTGAEAAPVCNAHGANCYKAASTAPLNSTGQSLPPRNTMLSPDDANMCSLTPRPSVIIIVHKVPRSRGHPRPLQQAEGSSEPEHVSTRTRYAPVAAHVTHKSHRACTSALLYNGKITQLCADAVFKHAAHHIRDRVRSSFSRVIRSVRAPSAPVHECTESHK